jgi:thiosulfate reductase cytochrome b subunit
MTKCLINADRPKTPNGVEIEMNAAQRGIMRWIHIVCAIPIAGYIYSPFDAIPNYAPAVRFIFLPIMVLSGLWMWKGHLVRRLVARKPA